MIMYELSYFSKASTNIQYNDLKDILESSRNFNEAQNISGCLLHYNNQFVQLVEGEKIS